MKKLRGTLQPCRTPKNEVRPEPETPVAPAWLDAEAKAEWKRVVPHLAELGILARVDGAVLADYCTAHSLAVRATKRYQREGLMISTAQGPLKHPMINVAKEARAQAQRLGAEFGLSPASRSRISAPEKPEEKPQDDPKPVVVPLHVAQSPR